MNNKIQNKNQVSLCRNKNCIHANGKNADLIAKGAFVMLLMLGFASLIRASK